MAAPKSKSPESSNKQFSPLVVLTKFPKRLTFTVFMVFVLTAIFSVWIWAAFRRGDMSWYTVGLPLIFVGMLVNFIHPEEEWQYTPWQEATQKYEKNIYD